MSVSLPPTEFRYDSLGEAVAQWLAQEIILGRLESGRRLRETEIADRLEVSRSPVREALQKLAVEGLVEIAPRRGTRVAVFDATNAGHLYDCRLMLEPSCYALAAESLTTEQIDELGTIVHEMEQASQTDEIENYLNLDLYYHHRLAHLCPNTVLVELLDVLWRRSVRYRHMVLRLPSRPRTSLHYHRKVQAAVGKRDAARVAEVTRELLLDSKNVLLAALKGGDHTAR